MGFGNSEKIRFCSITKEGKVQLKEDGHAFLYDYVEGVLASVSLVVKTFGNEEAEMVQIDLRDDEGLIRLGTSAHGNAGRSIVLSLGAIPGPGMVRIRPYKNRGGVYRRRREHGGRAPPVGGTPGRTGGRC